MKSLALLLQDSSRLSDGRDPCPDTFWDRLFRFLDSWPFVVDDDKQHGDPPCSLTRQAAAGPLRTLDQTYRRRVAEAATIAEGRRSDEGREACTLSGVTEPLAVAIAVDCYAGHRGDEMPRRFIRGDQLVEILAVVEQWRTPDYRYFRVRAAEETYTLRQDVRTGGWEVTEL